MSTEMEDPNRPRRKLYRVEPRKGSRVYTAEYWGGKSPNDGEPQTEYPDYDRKTINFAHRVLKEISATGQSTTPLSRFTEGRTLDGSLPIGSVLWIDEDWRMDIHTKDRDEPIIAVFRSTYWAVMCAAARPNPYGEKVISGFPEARGAPDFRYRITPAERIMYYGIFERRSDVFPPAFTVGDIWRDSLAGDEQEGLRRVTRVEVHAIGTPRPAPRRFFGSLKRLAGLATARP